MPDSTRWPGFSAFARCAVGDEHVAEPPYGLDMARVRVVFLDDLAQARDLHVDRAVEHAILAAARELHELVARQRLARMLHQHFQHRELPRGQGDGLAVARPAARGGGEFAGAEAMELGIARARP